jgi:outer membrane lipoprotein
MNDGLRPGGVGAWGLENVGLLALLASLAAGCVRPPSPLDIAPVLPVTVAEAQAKGLTGQVVRWGGTIVSVTPAQEETCFQVVSRPLDGQARPLLTDDTDGRFIACAKGFYDPAIYAAGREITVVGSLTEPTTGSIGDRPYIFPRVAVDGVFLWPQRRLDRVVYYPVAVWYPYWGPGPYWWWWR